MKNIDKIKPFRIEIKPTDLGIITTLFAEFEVSVKDSLTFENGKTILASYLYNATTYHLVYTIIDNDGVVEDSFQEDDGILPTLFICPQNRNYVSVVPYHPDKELELSVPVFNREAIELPKGNRPFSGNFINTCKHYAIFYDVDSWSVNKPDKIMSIEFKDTQIRKKRTTKIPLPKNNKIFIQNHTVHLLAKEKDQLLHREIDETGDELARRYIVAPHKSFKQILKLSFHDKSYLLHEQSGEIAVTCIETDGTAYVKKLYDLTDPFYNTWQPVEISPDTFITRFNGEFGNGWFTIKNDQLIELFYSKGQKGYQNLLTNEVLVMEQEKLIISSINKTKDNAYAVIFYPPAVENSNKIIIFNREITFSEHVAG